MLEHLKIVWAGKKRVRMRIADIKTVFRPGQRLSIEDLSQIGDVFLICSGKRRVWWLKVETKLGGTSLEWTEDSGASIEAALDSVSQKIWEYIDAQ